MKTPNETTVPKKKLRELTRIAYEKELREHLVLLFSRFSDWNAGEFNTWDLVELIHKFHDGPARELYSRYQTLPTEFLIVRALTNGLVSIDDIPKKLRNEMGKKAKSFRGNNQ